MQPRSAGFHWPQYLLKGNPHTRIAVILAILHHVMQQVSPHTRWKQRLQELLAEFDTIPRQAMGLPDNWEQDAFWCEKA